MQLMEIFLRESIYRNCSTIIIFECSEQRNNTTFVKSSVFTHLLKSECGIAILLDSVSITLGNIQFTFIFDSFTSSDIDSTSLIGPDFDAA